MTTKKKQPFTHLGKTPFLPLSQPQLHSHTQLIFRHLCSPFIVSASLFHRHLSSTPWRHHRLHSVPLVRQQAVVVSFCCSFLPTFLLCFRVSPPQAALPSGKYMLWCGFIQRSQSLWGYICARSLADGVAFGLWWARCGADWNQLWPVQGNP